MIPQRHSLKFYEQYLGVPNGIEYIGVNSSGLGFATPRYLAGGSWGIPGGRRVGRERVSENTIANFAQKVR